MKYRFFFVLCIIKQKVNYMKNKKKELEKKFFKNWCKNFLAYIDAQEHPDFPNKRHRRLWGIDE